MDHYLMYKNIKIIITLQLLLHKEKYFTLDLMRDQHIQMKTLTGLYHNGDSLQSLIVIRSGRAVDLTLVLIDCRELWIDPSY